MKSTFNNAEKAYNNFDNFWSGLIAEKTIEINLQLQCEYVNTRPQFIIEIDNTKYYNKELDTGMHNINISSVVTDKEHIDLKMSMQGKAQYDTIIDNDDNIVQDTCIKIISFDINKEHLMLDPEFLYNFLKNFNNDIKKEIDVCLGWWYNSTLSMHIKLPFREWYSQNARRNFDIDHWEDSYGLNEAELIKNLGKLKR
tara:strand:- start:120 stop:713 length:594 start_codon:yes stop_codon:yes gene_type:complete